MIAMILFWVFFVLFIIFAIIVFSNRIDRRTKDVFVNLYFFSIIMMGLFLIYAIVTNDPFLEFIPIFNEIKNAGWEIALSVFIFGIALVSSWIYLKKEYLKPIRGDITILQTKVSAIDERTINIDKNVDRILNRNRW